MAKMVTITRDMRPWRAGDRVAIQDDELVNKLVKDGEAKDPGPYPPSDVAPDPNSVGASDSKPSGRPILSRPRGYSTRKRG